MHTSLPARAGIAGAAVTGLFALSISPASASPASDGAAHFLAAQLAAGGNHLSQSVGSESYDDIGLTLDAILGLDATKSGQAEAAKAASYVVANGGAYVGTGSESYAGATAKTLVMTQSRGLAPVAGGANLVTRLKALETSTGQFKDKSIYGDYSNSIGQSLALIGLKRAGAGPDAKAVTFLLNQQCADGGFRLGFSGACTSDPDVTSFAVQALSAVGKSAAATKGANFLATKQNSAGGVGGGTATSGANANSTGLAAVAFQLTGKTANAAKASAWVKGLQYDCTASSAMRGGIAYNAAAKASNKSLAAPIDQDLRSTSQAVLGLTLTSYANVRAGGAAVAPALSCGGGTTGPTSSPTTSKPANPTGPASSTTTTSTGGSSTGGSTTSVVTGPPVQTDGPSSGDNAAVLGLGGSALLITAGAVAAYARRRH